MSAIVSILMEISCLFPVSLLIIMFVFFMAKKTFCLSVSQHISYMMQWTGDTLLLL